MKILQVTPFFPLPHGGSALVPYHISRELAKRGHQVTVYTSDDKISRELLAPVPGLGVYPFKTLFSWFDFTITPGMIKRIKEEINQFDIIHLHNYRTFQNIITVHYAQKYHIPYILQGHGSVASFFQRATLKRIFDLPWGHNILKSASRLLAVSPIEVEQYLSMGVEKQKIAIIPNGIDLSEFQDLPEKGKFRREFGLKDNQKIILYLGRIDKIKGLDMLVEAFSNISKNYNDTKLAIVGPNWGFLKELKKLIVALNLKDNVLVIRPLYKNNRLEAFVDANVFVLPSSHEIFGITALEATACGIPTIVTDRCGIAHWGKSLGLLPVPYDKDRLEEALLRVLTGGFSLNKDNGEFLQDNFNWPVIVEKIELVYKDLIQKTR